MFLLIKCDINIATAEPQAPSESVEEQGASFHGPLPRSPSDDLHSSSAAADKNVRSGAGVVHAATSARPADGNRAFFDYLAAEVAGPAASASSPIKPCRAGSINMTEKLPGLRGRDESQKTRRLYT